MTEHRPPIVSLIDYGRRVEIPARGESGSNGLITQRAGFDSQAPPHPAWKDDVARRVADYKARRADREWRANQALGLEPGARRSAARPSRGYEGAQRAQPATSSSLRLRSAWRRRLLRAALICWSIAALFFLPDPWRAGVALGCAAALLLVATLKSFDALGPEPGAGVTNRARR